MTANIDTIQRKKILFVEDETLIALNAQSELEQYGYSVDYVTNGEKAVETVLDSKTEGNYSAQS